MTQLVKNNIRNSFLFILTLGVIFTVGFYIFENLSVKAQGQIKIFPTSFSGNWQNSEAAFLQDLEEQAPFGEFNKQNSAYPLEARPEPIIDSAGDAAPETIYQEFLSTSTSFVPVPKTLMSLSGLEERLVPYPEEETTSASSEEVVTSTDEKLNNEKTETEIIDEEVVNIEQALIVSNLAVSPPPDTKIKNAQLRLSLAVQGKIGDKLLIDYYYQDSWHNLADFNLENRISNFLNSGYFLYGLPVFENWKDLESLKIRFIYRHNSLATTQYNNAPEIFLDAVWIEIDYEEYQTEEELAEQQVEIQPEPETYPEESEVQPTEPGSNNNNDSGGAGGAGSEEDSTQNDLWLAEIAKEALTENNELPTEITAESLLSDKVIALEEAEEEPASEEKQESGEKERQTNKLPRIKIKEGSLIVVDLGKKDFRSNEEPTFIITEPSISVQDLISAGVGEEMFEAEIEEEIETKQETENKLTTTEPISTNEVGEEEATTSEPILEATITESIPETTTTEVVDGVTTTEPIFEATSTETINADSTTTDKTEILIEEIITNKSTSTGIENEDLGILEKISAFFRKIGMLFKKGIERIVSRVIPKVKAQTNNIKIKVFDPRGEESPLIPQIVTYLDGDKEKSEIRLPRPKTGFKPGAWKMQIELETAEAIFVVEQDFTWGVLAINTNKSIYLPKEKAYLQMAVLTFDGHTICDASLKLEIVSPDNKRTYPNVQRSGECLGNNVTQAPDYFTYYQVNATGTYLMKLTNLGNGYEISDSFEVKESVLFDVERIGPTRIYPPHGYEMTLKIKANQIFHGNIIESVPDTFEIADRELEASMNDNIQYSILNVGDENRQQFLVWEDVTLQKSEELELSYIFDAPDIAPYLYLLGPLEFKHKSQLTQNTDEIFKESRYWQVAADAIAMSGIVSTGTDAGVISITVSHNTPSGSNRLMLVGISYNNDGGNELVSTVTYDSVDMGSAVGTEFNSDDARMYIYKLVAPNEGTHNATVTLDTQLGAGRDIIVGVMTFTGVSQYTPLGAFFGNSGNTVGPNSVTITDTVSGDLGFFVMACEDDCRPISVDDETERWNLDPQAGGPGYSQAELGAGSTQLATTTSLVMTWNHSYDHWAMGAVAIKPATTTADDITVSATSTQVSSMVIPSTNNYVGGAFVITNSSSTSINVTDIIITEKGSVNAQDDLDNIALYYDLDTSSPYDCSSESYDGGETQFNATDTDGFSSANGTSSFSGSVAITTTTTMCVYTLLDIGSGASDNETLAIEISDPSSDVGVSAGTVEPSTVVAISGTTTLQVPIDVTVSATSTQVSSLDIPSTNNYVGGAFVITNSSSTSINVTDILITENGSVDAKNNLDNIALYYDLDTASPYDCSGESFGGGETQFGATDTDAFSSENGTSTFNGSVSITTTTSMCVYVLLDVGSSATTSDTLEIKINDPSNDVTVSGGTVTPDSAVELSGTTNLYTPADLQQLHYRWRYDNGEEGSSGSSSIQASSTVTITTTSNTYVLADDMTITPGAGDYHVWFSSTIGSVTDDSTINVALYLNGAPIDYTERESFTENSFDNKLSKFTVATHARLTGVEEGQAIEAKWKIDTGTATMHERTLLVEKITASDSWQATSTTNISTTSAAYVIVPGMATTTAAGDYHVWFSSSIESSGSNSTHLLSLFLDGVKIDHTERETFADGSIPNTSFPVATHARLTGVTEGQVIDVRWNTTAGTITMHERTLLVEKITASDSWQATATADISTTSAAYGVADGMTTTTAAAGDYNVWFSSSVEDDTGETTQAVSLFLDDTKIDHTEREVFTEGSIPTTSFPVATHALLTDVTEGQVIDVRWQTSGGTATMHERTLVISKLLPASGGATFILDEDQGLANFVTASTTRLRFLISNEGGQSTTTNYRVDVAKNPTCSSGSYSVVPTDYSGHWHIATSTYITDGESTSNIDDGGSSVLTDPVSGNTFTAGKLKDTNSTTGNITLSTTQFTEIEFALLAVEGNADAGAQYCFRLSYGGADGDFTYTIYATTTMTGAANQAPTVVEVSFNNGTAIDLTENTTTLVTSTATTSDANGWDDISSVQGKIYRLGVGASCSTDDNNCYEDTSCATSSCSGNSCITTCEFNVQFHADPTVTGTPWDAQYWVAWIEATDSQSETGSATNTTETIEMNDLVALEIIEIVYYGLLYPGSTTDPISTTTQVINTGNTSLDLVLYGTNMTSGGDSINVTKQKYATSSVAYAAAAILQLSPGEEFELNLAKTTDSGSKQTTDLYWGIEIPNPQATGAYSGQNTLSGQKNELPWP